VIGSGATTLTLLRSQHLGLGPGRSIDFHNVANAQFGTRCARWVGMVTSSWRIVKYSQSPRITQPRFGGSSMENGSERRSYELPAARHLMGCDRRIPVQRIPVELQLDLALRSRTSHRRRTKLIRSQTVLCLDRRSGNTATDNCPEQQYLPGDVFTPEVEFHYRLHPSMSHVTNLLQASHWVHWRTQVLSISTSSPRVPDSRYFAQDMSVRVPTSYSRQRTLICSPPEHPVTSEQRFQRFFLMRIGCGTWASTSKMRG